MATYALIHGAGDVGWHWHVVERVLRERGHRTVAPDLPIEDPSIPTHLVLCRDDRFFPAAWLRNVVRARLRIEPDELGSGHNPGPQPSDGTRRPHGVIP